MLKQLFLSILEISITTSIVILAVKFLSCFINKNYAAKWKKWIWLIIAVRLLIPLNFLPFNSPIQLNIPDSNRSYNLSYTKESDRYTDAEVKGSAEFTETAPVMGAQDETTVVQGTENIKPVAPWIYIGIIVWSIGFIVIIIYHVIGYLSFTKRILRWSRVMKELKIDNMIADISAQFCLKKQLKVYVCDQITSPSLMGFIHPVLVIPADHYSDKELTFIFKHELTHYKQHDLWYKLLLLVANAAHWFNPAVYLLRREAYMDLELSCDDEVIKVMSAEDKKVYGETILSCISHQKMRKVALTTCFNNTTRNVKDRLKNILSPGKKRNGRVILLISAVLVISTGALVTFTGGDQKQKDTGEFTWYGAVSLITKDLKLPEKLIQNDVEWNEFLESDSTVALTAEIPEEDIYVYGLKENGTEAGTYTLHGVLIKQGNEIQVLDLDWGVYGELPKIWYDDYDGDGIKELAMISRSSSGTNISVNDLHILEKNSTGGWTDNSFLSSDWQDIINNRLKYQVQAGILTVTIDGEDTGYRINLTSLEEEWGEKLNEVFFGYGKFTFENGKIYLQVLPAAIVDEWATPQSITDTYIQMEVLYDGKFDLKNAFISK